ncbi:agmatine deiminase family protein [Streptomyces sp. NPDC048650]|uniref:agmatine deiminase family protein n=1 Tax=unclassified Streptomyces TaxID=2593676 RepID=UPI0037171EDC
MRQRVVLCNDAVSCAHFGDAGADAAAKATSARRYPDRAIEQLDIDRLGTGRGGIHCVTQQQPVAEATAHGRSVGRQLSTRRTAA